MRPSSSSSWKQFLQQVQTNQYLQNESTDTSLQPGEEYPKMHHPYMVDAHKQGQATMNQITLLLTTTVTEVDSDCREEFIEQRATARSKWPYPYTAENPCGTQVFEHWETQFNTAVLQIVSTQFERERRLTK